MNIHAIVTDCKLQPANITLVLIERTKGDVMNLKLNSQFGLLAVLAASLFSPALASATIVSVKVFATGTTVNATNPDSICEGHNSIWFAYTTNSVSTGGAFSSLCHYDLSSNDL